MFTLVSCTVLLVSTLWFVYERLAMTDMIVSYDAIDNVILG